jgi:[acyl-carrier-protein] S-malonyltransferase
MIAWLFPGQGTQTVGMGRDLSESSPAAREVFAAVDAALGFPLTRLMFEGPAEELQLTINAQPAIVAVSLAALAALQEAWSGQCEAPFPLPSYVAGHSVGEYSAVVAAGALEPGTGFRLVRERARLMHEAGLARPGGMVAVLGLSLADVNTACRAARDVIPGSYVTVANHNSDTQLTIAGDAAGLAAAADLCRQAGARRCLPLAVSGAFHSQAMEPAAKQLERAVAAAALRDARAPLVANASAQVIVAATDLERELGQQVASPVLWAESVDRMIENGVDTFLELGSGQVLTNLVLRREPGAAAMAVGDAATARIAVPWLRERAGL